MPCALQDSSGGNRGEAAQFGEQRQKRQAENGEIIALDPLEKLNAETFHLVAANAFQHLIAQPREIFLQKGVGETSHGERRAIRMTPDDRIALRNGDTAMQDMRLAAEEFQIGPGFIEAFGLVEAAALAAQDLVGADDQCIGTFRGDGERFRFGQLARSARSRYGRKPCR